MAVLRTRKKVLLFVVTMLLVLIGTVITSVVVYASSYHTIRVNYHFTNGAHAHDPYIATFTVGDSLNYDITNPNVNGFEPMMLTNDENDPAELPTGGVSAEKIHIETASLDQDYTYDVYYVAGLTHYAARYYLQNIYDDLYTLDRERTDKNQNRLGKTGSSPDDLEAEKIEGFTSLFHEPDAIAADGSTVFRVYYDRNYYAVNFDLGEGGYGVEPIYAKYGTVYRLDTPVRMGYTFKGWARTSADSSKGTYGEDWVYLKPNTNSNDYYDEEAKKYNYPDSVIMSEADATADENLIQLDGEQHIRPENTFYRAIWEPGTTSFSVAYWFENAEGGGYSVLATKDVYKVENNRSMSDVVAGTTVDQNTMIRNYAKKAQSEGMTGNAIKGAKNLNITDFFHFNLNSADPNNALNNSEDSMYRYDINGTIIDFNDMSKGTSTELTGCEDFFELNTAENTSDPRYVTDTSVTVRGDGTTQFNVFFKRKTFTLKFYYARQGYTNGALDPNKISLTNSTKQFNYKANDAKYLNTSSKNVLEAIAEGSWAHNTAESLPTVKDEYKHIVTEGYNDFVDNGNGYYRYYYYQIQAKYNEPLKDKWLIDALNNVHRKNSDAKEMCIPGSIATEYYNKYYQDRKSSPNFTVKGVYEKLGKGILFTDDARTTMKQQNIDYTELHFLISWTNTDYTNGWNSSIENVLHFRYENYTELLPREVEIIEHSGEQALLAEGHYDSVRTFTTKVKENDNWVDKTKWYGLSTDHVYETIDSGDVYKRSDSESKRNNSVYTNQTATAMTGFELEYYRETNGFLTLDTYNTEIDWSQDTKDYRRAIIKFFYRRLEYTLMYRNGNRLATDHTHTVMYGAPMNSTYTYSEDGHEAGEYRYYWSDPEYFDENRRDFYTFNGWYNDPRYEDDFDLNTQTMPADDDTLYAHWVPKSIDVIFYDDYDDFYIDRKGDHPEKRVKLGEDDEENDIRDINVDYGSYVPNQYIPVDDDSPDNPRPKLNPIAEGASFAGWYYIRNRVPVRYEPENVPVTALNDEATGDHAKLRLFAEWVTKDVAKYKVKYVNANDTDQELAAPTTGRAYVWKTKTFNAKSGDELYDDYKWTQEGEDAGTNWWPIDNSSSMVIRANNSDDEYAPNNMTFRYIQKSKVHYKVQYLDASTRTPLRDEVEKESTHASVKEDAKIIPGFVPTTASQTLVLTASSNTDSSEAEAEELQNNVITFLYEENEDDYLYEVEYYTQDIGKNTYSLYTVEPRTIPIATQGQPVSLAINTLFNTTTPTELEDAGFTRVANGCKYSVINLDGTENPEQSVNDNGTVSISNDDKKIIKIYFNRNSYRYKYQYVDHTAEKAYLEYIENHKDDPDPTAGAPWDGVLQTFDDPSYTGQVEQEITINPATDYTYVDSQNDTTTNYTRITNNDGTLNDVTLTIQPVVEWNTVKIYYRKDIERELSYKMVCVNDNSETDYYDDAARTPKFGRLNFSMQTVLEYDDIQNIVFHDTNNEVIDNTDPQHPVYLHLHKYTFLGWYTTPTYDPDHPEQNCLTTNKTLSKADLGTNGDLPDRDTKYYALVKQDMVNMDVMFYYTDDYTVDGFRAEDDETLHPIIQDAVDNENNSSVADKNKVHPTGERVGKEATFTAPNGYINHTEIPWHRNDGYSLSMTDIDQKVYKYKFAEWWEVDKSNNNALIRHDNWNSPDGWDPDALSQQLARNKDQYLIAVYARRPVTELPYTINYKYIDRQGVERTFVKKGTLTASQLNENNPDSAVSDAGYFELSNEFILANAPYESNHGETLSWTDNPAYIEKTSVKGDPNSENPAEQVDRMTVTINAKQETKKVYAHYRLTADGEYSTIQTLAGSHRGMDSQLAVLDLRDNDNFSYWAIRQSENGPVIAKCYDAWFTYRIFSNYYISPVFGKTAKLNPTALAQNNEDWLAWTWNEGESGTLVFPDEDLTFTGLKDKVKFVRVPSGTTTLGENWSNIWNETGDLDTQDGQLFRLTHFGEYGTAMYGAWEEYTPGAEVCIAKIDYSRNRWTDENGNINANGSTDLLYSDYEISYRDNDASIQNNSDYTIGVIFELCDQLASGDEFTPDSYTYISDYTKLGRAALAVKNGSKPTSYKYDGENSRKIQINQVSTSVLTNMDRLNLGKYYKNSHKTVNGEEVYTNKTAIMKVTAYMIDKDNNVTLSNSVYVCLNDIGNKDLAIDSNTNVNNESNDVINDPYKED